MIEKIEYEYTTTQRFVNYASDDKATNPGIGPCVIYPALGEGVSWNLYDTQSVVFTQAVGPVQQSKQVLWVWIWMRCGKQHSEPQETFETAWDRRLAAGGTTNEVMESFAKIGWDLAKSS